MSVLHSSFAAALLGGLLSSSCCVVQLALNAFSIGCAGFSALSPYRPLFISLTTASLGLAHLRHRDARQSVAALAVAMALSGTPELVRLYNEGALGRLLLAHVDAESGAPPGSRKQCSAAGHEEQQTVRMQVQGLRCAACAIRLKHALLSQVAGVTGADVEFESGSVLVRGRGITSGQDLIACAQRLGYSSKLLAFEEEPPGDAARQGL